MAYFFKRQKSRNSEEKKSALATTIRNLVVMGWLRAEISESMLAAA